MRAHGLLDVRVNTAFIGPFGCGGCRIIFTRKYRRHTHPKEACSLVSSPICGPMHIMPCLTRMHMRMHQRIYSRQNAIAITINDGSPDARPPWIKGLQGKTPTQWLRPDRTSWPLGSLGRDHKNQKERGAYVEVMTLRCSRWSLWAPDAAVGMPSRSRVDPSQLNSPDSSRTTSSHAYGAAAVELPAGVHEQVRRRAHRSARGKLHQHQVCLYERFS